MTDQPCESHAPTARLVVDLPLVEQLRAIASCMPCEWPVGQIEPGSPIARLLNQCADALDEALDLVRSFDAFDSVPDDHGYVGSPLQAQVREFLDRADRTTG